MKVRADSPDIAIVIMTGYDDAMMEYEARRYNAEFVRKPIKPAEFLDVVALSLNTVRRQRRWPRKQVVGGFRVTAAGRPAAVVDVCYGGLRLEVPAAIALPPSFAVEVSGIGLNLEVQPVWSYPVAGRTGLLCGATLGVRVHPCRAHVAHDRRSAWALKTPAVIRGSWSAVTSSRRRHVQRRPTRGIRRRERRACSLPTQDGHSSPGKLRRSSTDDWRANRRDRCRARPKSVDRGDCSSQVTRMLRCAA